MYLHGWVSSLESDKFSIAASNSSSSSLTVKKMKDYIMLVSWAPFFHVLDVNVYDQPTKLWALTSGGWRDNSHRIYFRLLLLQQ